MKVRHDDFFDNSKTLEIYNSYEPYNLHLMKKFYKENNIECIEALDTDLDVYLKYFADVKYIHLHAEAVHLEEVNKLHNLNGISLSNIQIKDIDESILEKIEYLEIYYMNKKKIDFNKFKSLKHLKLKNYPFEDLKIDNNLVSLEIVDASKIIELKEINTNCLEKVKLSFLKKLENIEVDCSKLTLLYIFDCKKINDLEKLLYSCVNLKELDVITYSIKGGIFNNLNFIKELKFLEYFGTNYRILDGNLKPLLALQEANISSYYRNYNLRDKELPHVTVCITEGTCGHRVRLDTLELGKEDPRITWLW
jgi:hypothetical protein